MRLRLIRRHLSVLAIALGALATGCSRSPATGPATGEAGDSSDCPTDLLAARGTACDSDGKTCHGEGSGSFTHLLMCSHGKWTEMEAPPPPPPPPG